MAVSISLTVRPSAGAPSHGTGVWNKRVCRVAGICLIVSAMGAGVTAQKADELPWRVLNQAAQAAIAAKDYAKLRETLLALKPLLPGNPRNTYNLAASEAVLGHKDAALAGLLNLAEMGLVYHLPADEDFSSLSGTPAFAAVVARMEAGNKPVAEAGTMTALPAKDLLPEDLA